MPLPRALTFSICAAVANMAAITAGTFAMTALERGLTPDLVQQLLRIAGNMMSPGWLVVMVIAAGFSFAGWLVAQRAALASGAARPLLLVVATGLVALLPAGLALVVFNQAVVGLAIVFVVSGGAVVVASGAHAPPSSPRPSQQTASPLVAQRTGFGRRV